MNVLPYGDRGVLLADLTDATRCRVLARLEQELPTGCDEFVVGYNSILLVGSSVYEVESWLQTTAKKATARRKKPTCHDIAVSYNGPDLEDVAHACGLEVAELIRIHSAPTYTVRMIGFSPGFPYLDGLDPRLHLERRASPRPRIEPGAVAIGGSHAGIYSVASPGGWHLLGQIEQALFNLDAAKLASPTPRDVFVLLPGDQVRFHPKEVVK